MQKPDIPYNRPPKVSEMIDHLEYLIEQKKLFEDDIIIGIVNHTMKKEIEGKEQDYNYQEILIRRRDKPFVIPQGPNDDINIIEQLRKFVKELSEKCYTREIIKQLSEFDQESLIDPGFGNPNMVSYSTKIVEMGIDKIENTLHLMVFPSFPGSKDVSEYIGDGKVFNYNTGEEITDENKKNEILSEFREQYRE